MQNTIRTLWIGDVHVNASPPGWRTDTYAQDILAKLEFLMDQAEARQVDLILFAGDIFHSKRNVPISLIADLADVLRLADCEKIIVPGNHDLVDNNLADVWRRPIGMLARLPGVGLGLGPRTVGPLNITFAPYLHEPPADHFRHPALGGNNDGVRWRLLCAHYGITQRPMPYHTIVTDDPAWEPQCDVVFSGHIHDDLGVWKDPHGTLIFNLGSISRGSLTEDNLERTPRVLFTEWSAKPVAPVFEAISIPVRPASEVFNLEAAADRKEGERVAAEFLAELGSTVVQSVSLESVKSAINDLELTPTVKSYAVKALEDAWEDAA